MLLSISEQSIHVVQVTDSHLFENHDGNLLSVSTNESFSAVLDEILKQQQPIDVVLATGDISQDHTDASYQYFVDHIACLNAPCFWLPGNHDEIPLMHSNLNVQPVFPDKHVLVGEHWQFILLDSQVTGVPHGRLSSEQLDFMQQKLREYSDRHTFVCLHHHSKLVNSQWLDQHTLKNSEEFWKALEGFSNVKAVVGGHVHQELDTMHNGVRLLATPSTCIQFKPNSDQFALDNQSPGWREFILHSNGEFETIVKRLPNKQFQPDFSSSGY